jgi:hypothetical protein
MATMNPTAPQALKSTPKSPWYRRRLRTLLVTGMVVVVVMGWIYGLHREGVWAKWHLQVLGARVSFFKSFLCTVHLPSDRDAPAFLKEAASDLCLLSKRYELEVDISKTNVSDADLQQLAAIQRPFRLDLACTAITDQGLESLGKVKSLHCVNLCGTHVTAQGVKSLKRTLPSCEILWEPPKADEPQNDLGR